MTAPAAQALLPHYNTFNPRRKDFDITNPHHAKIQIKWEHDQIKFCDHIMFWFGPDTNAPITLFELGKVIGQRRHATITIGTDPKYCRRFDVMQQVKLELPTQVIHESLSATIDDTIYKFYGQRRS